MSQNSDAAAADTSTAVPSSAAEAAGAATADAAAAPKTAPAAKPAEATDSAEPTEPREPNRVTQLLKRTPFTLLFVVALLAIGVVTGAMFSHDTAQAWLERVGTGLPAFEQGRWWTLAVSPFFVKHPSIYLTILPLLVGGLGWAELRFGTLRTVGLFVAGHFVGVLGSAAILVPLANSGWPWAERVAASYDVGPSCGAFTALVFAVATLPAPWRLRARLAIGLMASISVLYLGRIDDLEHAVAMTAALVVSGWLPAFRRRSGRPTQREWRVLALYGTLAIGVIQVFDLIVPYDGPLGANRPVASFLDVAIDVVIIVLIADGIRKGYRVAWIVVLALGAFNVLTAVLAVVFLPQLIAADAVDSFSEALGLMLAPAVLWVLLVLLLITARSAFRVSMRRKKRSLSAAAQTREQLVQRLQRYGGGTISWMGTWEGNRIAAVDLQGSPSADTTDARAGETGAYAYQVWSDVAIMLGDPVVPRGSEGLALEQFEHVAQSAGLIPCAFSASGASAAAVPDGWRSVIVAEDTIVDLPDLKFTGKPWAAVRTAINRAGREDIEFRMTRLADEPWNVLAQVRAISEQWTGDKGLPEMRFTLGTVDEALDPETYVGLAIDTGGNLHGVTSWLPVYGPAEGETPRVVGWTLDLMRRRDGGFPPVMEFLIASSAQWFSQEGYEFVSLSGAPLVRPEEVEAGPVDRVLEQIGGLIEPLYGFKSLHKFKQKFNPRHESLYLLFRDEGDLPRIGIAITRAYLPDASLRDLLASASAGAATEAK